MASLLPGFEYDVFISYHHKDNEYDGWVTEFVSHLKKNWKQHLKTKFRFTSMKITMMVCLKPMMWTRALKENLGV